VERRRDPAVTSRMMSAVRNKDSRAELMLRGGLHARGLRYRVHVRGLPGRPDIVFRQRRLAIFVDGDMWHGNAWKVRGLRTIEDLYPNRTHWWVSKITRNIERDREVNAAMAAAGWSVLRLWESDILRGPAEAVALVVERLGDGPAEAI